MPMCALAYNIAENQTLFQFQLFPLNPSQLLMVPVLTVPGSRTPTLQCHAQIFFTMLAYVNVNACVDYRLLFPQ